MMPLPKPGPMPSCGPQERQAVDGDHGRYGRAHRGPARIERPRSCALATMAGQPPPKPCRNAEAWGETSGPAPHGAGGRRSGGEGPGRCRGAQRLFQARHPYRQGFGINLSGRRGGPAFSWFAQQKAKNARVGHLFFNADPKEVAGVLGFEPRNGGTKNRCLTAWRYPNAVRRCLAKAAGGRKRKNHEIRCAFFPPQAKPSHDPI